MLSLHACRNCDHLIRKTESTCPFCEAATPRRSRTPLLAMGALAAGLAVGGCGDDGNDEGLSGMTASVESDSAGEATYGVPMSESETDLSDTTGRDESSGTIGDAPSTGAEASSTGASASDSTGAGSGSGSGSGSGGSSSSGG